MARAEAAIGRQFTITLGCESDSWPGPFVSSVTAIPSGAEGQTFPCPSSDTSCQLALEMGSGIASRTLVATCVLAVGVAALVVSGCGKRQQETSAERVVNGQPARTGDATPVPTPELTPASSPVTPSRPPEKGDGAEQAPSGPEASIEFREDFAHSTFPGTKWTLTRENDFQEAVVDITDGRLRLRAATIGTRSDTVKFLGARTAAPVVDFASPVEVQVEIDWNSQANGCYLAAGLYLCPTATDINPRHESDWLRFEYVGVPPGKNARAAIWRKSDGREYWIYNEGWPKQQRTGRKIGLQRLRLLIDSESLRVMENGEALVQIPEHELCFTKAYVYLQMSTHSNYPPRAIFFDNVAVTGLGNGAK